MDGETDGIAVASTALAKRRAVKSDPYYVVFDTVIVKITWNSFLIFTHCEYISSVLSFYICVWCRKIKYK